MEEVHVNWEGKDVVVKLKKMSWGDQKKVIREALGKVRVLGGETPTAEIDIASLREAIVKYSIAEAPFEVTTENLEKLSSEDMDKLMEKAMELNPFRVLF